MDSGKRTANSRKLNKGFSWTFPQQIERHLKLANKPIGWDPVNAITYTSLYSVTVIYEKRDSWKLKEDNRYLKQKKNLIRGFAVNPKTIN